MKLGNENFADYSGNNNEKSIHNAGKIKTRKHRSRYGSILIYPVVSFWFRWLIGWLTDWLAGWSLIDWFLWHFLNVLVLKFVNLKSDREDKTRLYQGEKTASQWLYCSNKYIHIWFDKSGWISWIRSPYMPIPIIINILQLIANSRTPKVPLIECGSH